MEVTFRFLGTEVESPFWSNWKDCTVVYNRQTERKVLRLDPWSVSGRQSLCLLYTVLSGCVRLSLFSAIMTFEIYVINSLLERRHPYVK